MVSKGRIEGFIIAQLKEKVLTDENLSELVRMVNEEIRLLAGKGKGQRGTGLNFPLFRSMV
jgi:hypothetical protein